MTRRPLMARASESVDAAPLPASPWPGTRRRRESFPEKREALLNAAAALFRQRGYDGASLSELAERLNVTKPTLYYYVKNKDHLVRQIIARGQEEMLRYMRAAELRSGSAYEKLRAIMIELILVMTSDYGACLSLVGTREFEPETQAEIRKRREEGDRILYRLLSAGQRDGSIQVGDRIVTMHALFGSINWVPRWYKPEGRLPPKKFATQFVDILLSGVRPREAPTASATGARKNKPKA